MTCAGKRFILGVFLLFHYYVVYSEKLDQRQMVAPPLNDPSQKPITDIAVAVQQLSETTDNVGQIFYYRRIDTIMYANRKLNGSIIFWSPTGEKVVCYFKELRNEVPTLIMPVRYTDNEFIIGSDLHLRFLTKNNTDYTLSEPIISFDDPGFIIHAAKCDINGIMFILLVGKNADNKHLGLMYKVIKRKAVFVMQLNTNPRDFRFQSESDFMFVINDTSVTKYPYNSSLTTFGPCTEVFNTKEYPELENLTMTSIVLGRISPPHLFVAMTGIDGYVARFYYEKRSLQRIMPVPSNSLTFITYGTLDLAHILVGSKRSMDSYGQGAVYSITGGRAYGQFDLTIDW